MRLTKEQIETLADASWRVLNFDNDPKSGLPDDVHNWNLLCEKLSEAAQKINRKDRNQSLESALKKAKEALVELSNLGGGRSEGNLIARRAIESVNEILP